MKTLTVLDIALKIIKKTRGLNLKLSGISLEDHSVYEQLCSGDGLGIFQLESSGMRDLLVRLKPNCFEDIVALVALYRPGPLGSGMVDDFIDCKHERKAIAYELEALRPILAPTYGVIVYQEQVMQIASALANFTLGDADLLRRAMGKKKPEEMAQQKEKFMKGAAVNKIPKAKANKIFDLMAKFAEYGFNKSHSAAYALVSYYTAYLKTHYTVEYMASLLTHEMGNTDKILVYIQDCREHGIAVLPPDVNKSFEYFSVENEKSLRFGLAGIKGVGDAAISSIIEEREKDGLFSSIFDFCSRVDLRRVNKKVFESLIKCGAFDSLNPRRASLMAYLDKAMEWGARRREDSRIGQRTMFDLMSAESAVPKLPEVSEWPEVEKWAKEKEALGFYITGHPLTRYQELVRRLTSFDTQNLEEAPDKSEVALCGMVAAFKEIRTKKGKRMAFIDLEDLKGKVEVVVFNDVYEKVASLFQSDIPIYVKGTVEQGEEGRKILASDIQALEEAQRSRAKAVHLRVQQDAVGERGLEQLRDILHRHPGNLPTYLHLFNSQQEVTVLEMPQEYRVTLNGAFVIEITQLLGSQGIFLP